MAAAGQGSSAPGSFSQEEAPGVQVFWTPNMGCNIRVDLTTGVPEYSSYMKSPSWMARRGLRTIGEDGKAFYKSRTPRVFPKNIPVAHLKMRPDEIPRHPGHQDKAAYF